MLPFSNALTFGVVVQDKDKTMCMFCTIFLGGWGVGASTHLFNSEVVYEVVVVLIEAAVQGYTVRVNEQVLQGGHTLQAQ